MRDLTDKQEIILKFITKRIHETGMSPTIREIGDEFEITAKGAYDHLKAIEKKGFLKTAKNQSRAIEVVKSGYNEQIPARAMSVPLIGRVAAGQPIFAEENIEDYLPVPDRLSKRGKLFALRVAGDSMIDEGINDGDIAIFQKRESARDGDIVVALVEEEATLKTFFLEKDSVRLQPANSKYKPIRSKRVQVMGKLVGLYRFY